jgi:hypothetical protein
MLLLVVHILVLLGSVTSEDVYHFYSSASADECSMFELCGAMGRQPCGGGLNECGPCINGFIPMDSDSRICRRIRPGDKLESTEIVTMESIPGSKQYEKRAQLGGPIAMGQRASAEVSLGDDNRLHVGANKHTMTFIILVAFTVSGIVLIGSLGLVYHKYSTKELKMSKSAHVSYGVAGNDDVSEEKELARKTQIYHYQHQKRIISSMENRGKSVDGGLDCGAVVHAVPAPGSKPVSAGSAPVSPAGDHCRSHVPGDETEEELDPDFTVYECPGLAPSGEMEVKNPLFDNEYDDNLTTDEE